MRDFYICWALFILCFWSCNSNTQSSERKEVIALVGCEDVEVIEDIEYSIQGILKDADKYNIIIQTKADTSACGYILVFGDKTYSIESALTDVDLWEKCRNFFALEMNKK